MSDWQPIEDSPEDTVVQLRTRRGRQFLARMVFGDVENEDGPCWSWRAEVEGKHPACWTDGYCWEVNEHLQQSEPPVAWRYPPQEGGA